MHVDDEAAKGLLKASMMMIWAFGDDDDEEGDDEEDDDDDVEDNLARLYAVERPMHPPPTMTIRLLS